MEDTPHFVHGNQREEMSHFTVSNKLNKKNQDNTYQWLLQRRMETKLLERIEVRMETES